MIVFSWIKKGIWLVAVLYVVAHMYSIGPVRALTVFDPTNFAQNYLTAIRNFEQINNQIQMLSNQVDQLLAMRQNLVALPDNLINDVVEPLSQLQSLVSRADALAFNIDESTRRFSQTFPNDFENLVRSKDGVLNNAASRWQNLKKSYETALGVQSQTIQIIEQDGEKLARLMTRSSTATGNLQVSQAGNEIQAMNVRTMLKLLTLITTKQRAETLREAEEAQVRREGNEDLKNFFRRRN